MLQWFRSDDIDFLKLDRSFVFTKRALNYKFDIKVGKSSNINMYTYVSWNKVITYRVRSSFLARVLFSQLSSIRLPVGTIRLLTALYEISWCDLN